jgi:tetratricopeptide (TPR) repeat protein
LTAGEPEEASALLFSHLGDSWNGAREPLSTLSDLQLLEGTVKGRMLALKNRWEAEALRHVGRTKEALEHALVAQKAFSDLGDKENLAHCLRLLGHLHSERGNSQEGLKQALLARDMLSDLKHTLGQAQCEAVIGEIEYLLGNYEKARSYIAMGEKHFASLDQHLGRGQCLLLLSWIAHSEGVTEESRRLTLEAREEFEGAGYRLGTAQANASLAHVDHRLLNYHSAEAGARDALSLFESLHTPRGQAACHRLLAMIGIDTDDPPMAEHHAELARQLYADMGDPWGQMEARLLNCALALMAHDADAARTLLDECANIVVEELEPQQHYLLTRAWIEAETGDLTRAEASIKASSEIFSPLTRVGDHTAQLLGRLARYPWSEAASTLIHHWRDQLIGRREAPKA